MSAAIEKCSAYEGIDTCKTCESGYSPADDKKTCSEATVDPPAASGSVISFSLVLTIVGLLIAWNKIILLLFLLTIFLFCLKIL